MKREIEAAFLQQAEWCKALGSPFTATLLESALAVLDETTLTGRMVLNWPGTAGPLKDVVPLRLAGALHSLVLSGADAKLVELYPPNIDQVNELATAIVNAVSVHDRELSSFLDHAPQTNEVSRSSVLIAGLAHIAQQTGLEVEIFEIGASGGLNLNLDRFEHRLGPQILGLQGADLRLSPKWIGPVPTVNPKIVERQGCDLNPLDVSDIAQVLRLLSYVWPDQPERLARTRKAITIAQKYPPNLIKADAADWVEKVFKSEPTKGRVRVLVHSIAWQYMPNNVQERITNAIETAGKIATLAAPIAWLAFELDANGKSNLRIRSWPQKSGWSILAKANPHVHDIEWLPASAK
ncbi:DUF2332 domain-containing protein [Marivita sp. S0852]|uniref:DUF2332 domain-containing protein n=1 Tax=Marivita sp. S0852 TaxID=3373893 RepID=UPI003982AA82